MKSGIENWILKPIIIDGAGGVATFLKTTGAITNLTITYCSKYDTLHNLENDEISRA